MTAEHDAATGPPARAVPAGALSLVVIYTEQLEACRAFYIDLGLPLVREQHGSGPVHVAAELADSVVLELYPGEQAERPAACGVDSRSRPARTDRRGATST